ncbi:hypothetical protein D3C73_1099230 [compost metagenome]
MHRAGVLQYLPVFATQPGTVPEHQRGQRAASTLGIHRLQTLADAVAPGPLGWRKAFALLDRPGRPDVLCQQPGLVVERLRIEEPDRALQFDCQTPALPTVHRRPAVPGQAHLPRQAGTPGLDVGQFETHDTVVMPGQASDPPFDPAGFSVQRRRQPVIQRPLRIRAGPTQTEQIKRHRIRPEWQQHQTRHRHRQPQPDRRQHR